MSDCVPVTELALGHHGVGRFGSILTSRSASPAPPLFSGDLGRSQIFVQMWYQVPSPELSKTTLSVSSHDPLQDPNLQPKG